jgi:hypothetical protein
MASRRRTFTAVACATAFAALTLAAPASAEPAQGQIAQLAAGFNGPWDTSVMPDGAVLVAEGGANRIRRIATDGTVTTVAGTGATCPTPTSACGDGGAATAAQLTDAEGVASTGDGGFLIADSADARVRRVSPGGTISTVAGTGSVCGGPPCGDGGAATSATLARPKDVAVLPGGGYLVADQDNDVVRMVTAGGTISTVAGNYTATFDGDGPATAHALNDPFSVSPTRDGGFLIADEGNQRIRKVVAGTMTTDAGTGLPACGGGPCGDNGPAKAAQLNNPDGVASRPDDSYYISDSANNRIRRVDTNGVITNAAGDPNGGFGNSGDGGPATSAFLNTPADLSQCGNSVIVADFGNNRVRWFGVPPLGGTNPCVPPPATITSGSSTPAGGGGGASAAAPPPLPPPTVPPPVLGSAVDATPIAGVVLVRLPGQSAFTALGGVASLPIGTEFDTTKGTVEIDFATGVQDPHSAVVSLGRFKTAQATATGSALQLPLTGKLRGCPRAGRASADAVAARASTRKVNVKAKGPVKTRGRYGAATVRGTAWTITDRCNTARAGTLVAVTEGVVAVSDQVKHKTVLVRAGKRYFARAKRRR